MQYVSTRSASPEVDFERVLLSGVAPDGGLYVPEHLPRLPGGWRDWDYSAAVSWSLGAFGAIDVVPLVADAVSRFRPEVAPLVEVGDRSVFELFWGPTLSFKDHALQVLGRLLARATAGNDRTSVVLGATSGDTGSAAIEGCRGYPNLRVVILFPDGMVSEFQRRQMTTVPDENMLAVSVRGTFDDCQAMVKQAFAERPGLLAVNSINWVRIAAQIGYYTYLGTLVGSKFDVVIPTGNFGNALSCWSAKQMGVPIETITLSNNSNHRLVDAINASPGGDTPVVPTLAPAMDIAIPSNWERFSGDPTIEFAAGWASDEEIAQTIAHVHAKHRYLLDPHTATAWRVGESTRTERPQVVVATAHPAKFGDAVARAIGAAPELPEGYREILELPERMETIEVSSSEFYKLIR